MVSLTEACISSGKPFGRAAATATVALSAASVTLSIAPLIKGFGIPALSPVCKKCRVWIVLIQETFKQKLVICDFYIAY